MLRADHDRLSVILKNLDFILGVLMYLLEGMWITEVVTNDDINRI